MTKRDITDRIALATDTPTRKTAFIIDMFLEEVADELERSGVVELRRFGTFKAVQMGARTVQHPRSGEPIEIPAQLRVRFKASKMLTEQVNGEGEE